MNKYTFLTFVAAVVLAAGVFMPGAANAQSAAKDAEINRLVGIIEQLTATLNAGSGAPTTISMPTYSTPTGMVAGVSTAACPFTWSRNLRVGDRGIDVMKLQQFLNTQSDTRVTSYGAGSPGFETQYFGQLTANAVARFQAKYAAEVLYPVGVFSPTGYFGPSTRNKANSLCGSAIPYPSDDDNDRDDDRDDDDRDDRDDDDDDRRGDVDDLRGEGTLDTFEIDDASNDDIEEGAEDEDIAELTLEARDGDILLTRMDVAVVGINSPEEDEPWDVFEDFSLWVDGDRVARFDDADDEDEYLDEDDGTFRFRNLDLVLEEDEEVEMIIRASVQNNVDGAGTDADWSVAVEEVRYFDADDVATDEDNVDDMGTFVEFSIVTEGEGEELNFSLSSDNPDAMDIVVDTDRTTDDETILIYEIEAEDNDIEIDNLFVTVVTSDTTSDVVDDIELEIDGEYFRDDSRVVNSAFSTTYEFDIDGDIVIDEDDEVEVEVIVDLKAQEGRYPNGTTIRAQVTSSERDMTDAEGADDITEFSGTAIGDNHALVAAGISVDRDSVETDTAVSGSDDTVGEFEIEFEVTAIEDDFYITDDTSRIPASANTGVAYEITAPGGFLPGSSDISAILSSSADEETDGVFTVREGDTETFTLYVIINPNVAGQYRVGLAEVNYDDDPSGSASPAEYSTTPAQDYRTGYRFINN